MRAKRSNLTATNHAARSTMASATSPMDKPSTVPFHRVWWQLVRGENVIISGVATAVGMYLVRHGGVPATSWFLIPLAPMLITAAGNIQNDLADIDIDGVNRPDRPLPSGAVSPRNARVAMFCLYGAGLAVAATVGWLALAIAAPVAAGLTFYNARLSRLPLAGNLAVSIMGALPLVYGGVVSSLSTDDRWLIVVAVACIAFWLHLARELLKDTVDIDGDRAAGRRTFPILHGDVVVMRIASLTMLIASACAFWLGTTGWFSALYMFGICVTVLPALLYGAAQCWWRPVYPIAAFWTNWLKVIMLAGLVWMVLGARRV